MCTKDTQEPYTVGVKITLSGVHQEHARQRYGASRCQDYPHMGATKNTLDSATEALPCCTVAEDLQSRCQDYPHMGWTKNTLDSATEALPCCTAAEALRSRCQDYPHMGRIKKHARPSAQELFLVKVKEK